MGNLSFVKKALGLLVFLGILVASSLAQSKGDRFNGVWTVSRGGGGMGRIFLNGNELKGVLMDSGWLQMTGERRIGQLKGTIKNNVADVTIEWSTGAKAQFTGSGKVQRQGLILDLDQRAGDRVNNTTQFSLQAHKVGDPFLEPFGSVRNISSSQMAGEWSGSFTYGPNSGLTYVSVAWDGKIDVVMANERPNDSTWSAVGSINQRENGVDLTVDSGASKQAYKGKVVSIGPDQIQVTFDRKNGSFVMTLSRW